MMSVVASMQGALYRKAVVIKGKTPEATAASLTATAASLTSNRYTTDRPPLRHISTAPVEPILRLADSMATFTSSFVVNSWLDISSFDHCQLESSCNHQNIQLKYSMPMLRSFVRALTSLDSLSYTRTVTESRRPCKPASSLLVVANSKSILFEDAACAASPLSSRLPSSR